MASSSFRGGSSFYNGDAAHFRSREGLSTRPAASSDEIQLQIDPMQGDLDDEIVGLHSQVKRLRNIAQDIGTEAKSQQDFLDQLIQTSVLFCLVPANDIDKSSSGGEEQCKKIEQKDHTEWIKSCRPGRRICIDLFLYSIHVVENVQKMNVFSHFALYEWNTSFLAGEKGKETGNDV
ncbi:hypothetical protein Csa_001559 [Cucumis sativus]|nr:hypothetical protein Csa_001559 [Cucumis sativus]